MDFGSFLVRQFNADELEAVFHNKINKAFYPWAVIDTKLLQYYWFIDLVEPASAPRLGRIDVDLSQVGRVEIHYARYSGAVGSVLQQLAFFEWQEDFGRRSSTHGRRQQEKDLEGWLGFRVSFVLGVDHNLLGSPRRAPDLSGLQTEPSYVDRETGQHFPELPWRPIWLDKDETEAFKACIQTTGKLLTSLRAEPNGWPFMEVALGNFVKGFFTEGLEQMLWHITALEALLGDKNDGLTNRLARRIASIVARSENERKDVKKRFKELYDFRCDLVHGTPFSKQVYEGHLRHARDLARRTLLWFLHYLDEIRAATPCDQRAESAPTRDDILALLDLDQNARARLGWLIDNSPTEFPYIRDRVE